MNEEQMRADYRAWYKARYNIWPPAEGGPWQAWQAAAALYDRKAREECASMCEHRHQKNLEYEITYYTPKDCADSIRATIPEDK